jgi:hypothetical protein
VCSPPTAALNVEVHDGGLAFTVTRAGEDMMDIQPGTQVDVQCAFDVPVGTLAGADEVHGQAYSTGATVTVLSVG